jgi:hypothetical protein
MKWNKNDFNTGNKILDVIMKPSEVVWRLYHHATDSKWREDERRRRNEMTFVWNFEAYIYVKKGKKHDYWDKYEIQEHRIYFDDDLLKDTAYDILKEEPNLNFRFDGEIDRSIDKTDVKVEGFYNNVLYQHS